MKLSIRQRLFGLLAIIAVGLSVLVAISIWSYRAMIIDQTPAGPKNHTDNAYSIMAGYQERAGEAASVTRMVAQNMSGFDVCRIADQSVGRQCRAIVARCYPSGRRSAPRRQPVPGGRVGGINHDSEMWRPVFG